MPGRADPLERAAEAVAKRHRRLPAEHLTCARVVRHESVDLARLRPVSPRIVLDVQLLPENLADELDQAADADLLSRPEIERLPDRRHHRRRE